MAKKLLVALVVVIALVAITTFEKYREREQEIARDTQAAAARQEWESRLNRMFDERWRDMSQEVRAVLDSLATSMVAEMKQEIAETPTPQPTAESAPAAEAEPPARIDSLPWKVANAYKAALAALPKDLTAYERRVAQGEVAYLVRTRFELSESGLDSVLTVAGQ